ncbi:MAG: rhamnulose-1-phosphate aldolase [Ruminococcaceae bacterium]|nr:rhamnulose-1-phosphate aldolase [Oscillospiraceae bacterium]
MKVMDSAFARGFAKMADDGWQLRFHERNGGNLSYRIPAEEIEAVREDLNLTGDFLPIGTEVPGLAGEFFMVTGSGKYFSNVLAAPEENCCIIEVDEKGERYRVVWGLTKGGRPTSELPTHLMNHEVKKQASGGRSRVIYHCHPVNVIALSCVLPLTDRDFTLALWQNMTECPVVYGEGVGVVPWMVCGGRDIALATVEKIKSYNVVVWAQHGIFCAGADFDETFGLAHTVEKSAEIYVKVASMTAGETRRQVITRENFIELKNSEEFKGLYINPEFLK